ncbi:MAG: TetR/AcrR family transcriptional regulator [Gaiella sp.]
MVAVTDQGPSRRRNTRAGGARTRQRILVQAERLFAQKGYRGVSLREIAEATRIRSFLIQYHFGSKLGLYQEVLKRWDTEVKERLEESLRGVEGVPQAVDRIVDDLFDFFAANHDRLLLHLRAILGEGLPKLPRLDSVRLVAQAIVPRTDAQGRIGPRLLGISIEGILHNHLLAITRSRELFGTSADDPRIREQTKAHIKRVILAMREAERAEPPVL